MDGLSDFIIIDPPYDFDRIGHVFIEDNGFARCGAKYVTQYADAVKKAFYDDTYCLYITKTGDSYSLQTLEYVGYIPLMNGFLDMDTRIRQFVDKFTNGYETLMEDKKKIEMGYESLFHERLNKPLINMMKEYLSCRDNPDKLMNMRASMDLDYKPNLNFILKPTQYKKPRRLQENTLKENKMKLDKRRYNELKDRALRGGLTQQQFEQFDMDVEQYVESMDAERLERLENDFWEGYIEDEIETTIKLLKMGGNTNMNPFERAELLKQYDNRNGGNRNNPQRINDKGQKMRNNTQYNDRRDNGRRDNRRDGRRSTSRLDKFEARARQMDNRYSESNMDEQPAMRLDELEEMAQRFNISSRKFGIIKNDAYIEAERGNYYPEDVLQSYLEDELGLRKGELYDEMMGSNPRNSRRNSHTSQENEVDILEDRAQDLGIGRQEFEDMIEKANIYAERNNCGALDVLTEMIEDEENASQRNGQSHGRGRQNSELDELEDYALSLGINHREFENMLDDAEMYARQDNTHPLDELENLISQVGGTMSRRNNRGGRSNHRRGNYYSENNITSGRAQDMDDYGRGRDERHIGTQLGERSVDELENWALDNGMPSRRFDGILSKVEDNLRRMKPRYTEEDVSELLESELSSYFENDTRGTVQLDGDVYGRPKRNAVESINEDIDDDFSLLFGEPVKEEEEEDDDDFTPFTPEPKPKTYESDRGKVYDFNKPQREETPLNVEPVRTHYEPEPIVENIVENTEINENIHPKYVYDSDADDEYNGEYDDDAYDDSYDDEEDSDFTKVQVKEESTTTTESPKEAINGKMVDIIIDKVTDAIDDKLDQFGKSSGILKIGVIENKVETFDAVLKGHDEKFEKTEEILLELRQAITGSERFNESIMASEELMESTEAIMGTLESHESTIKEVVPFITDLAEDTRKMKIFLGKMADMLGLSDEFNKEDDTVVETPLSAEEKAEREMDEQIAKNIAINEARQNNTDPIETVNLNDTVNSLISIGKIKADAEAREVNEKKNS